MSSLYDRKWEIDKRYIAMVDFHWHSENKCLTSPRHNYNINNYKIKFYYVSPINGGLFNITNCRKYKKKINMKHITTYYTIPIIRLWYFYFWIYHKVCILYMVMTYSLPYVYISNKILTSIFNGMKKRSDYSQDNKYVIICENLLNYRVFHWF